MRLSRRQGQCDGSTVAQSLMTNQPERVGHTISPASRNPVTQTFSHNPRQRAAWQPNDC